MTHPVVSHASALVRAGDLTGAERALTAVADEAGDRALVALLDEVPPADLLAIMREYDSAKESVINLLVTPEQFARAVVLESRYGAPTHEHLIGMMNAVLHRDPEQTADFLRALGEQVDGLAVLRDYFSERWDELREFAATGHFDGGRRLPIELPDPEDLPRDFSERHDHTLLPDLFDPVVPLSEVKRREIADRDWMETAWVLRYEVPDLFASLIETLDRQPQDPRAARQSTPDRARPATPTGNVATDEESAL